MKRTMVLEEPNWQELTNGEYLRYNGYVLFFLITTEEAAHLCCVDSGFDFLEMQAPEFDTIQFPTLQEARDHAILELAKQRF